MTKRDILSISLKLIGIYCLSVIIISFPIIWNDISFVFNYKHFGINPYAYFIGFMISRGWQLGLAYILCRYSDSIAERLIPNDSEISLGDINQFEKSLFSVSLIIIGAGCLAVVVPNIIRTLTKLYSGKPGYNYGQVPSYNFEKVIGPIALLAFGGYLLTGGEHLVAFAFKKKIGPKPLDEPPDEDENS